MPQPFAKKDGETVSHGTRLLTTRPQCATKIAVVAAAWAYLESELAETFGQITGEAKDAPHGRMFRPNRVAIASLRALESLNARISIVQAALAFHLPSEIQEKFAKIAMQLRRCAHSRNDVIHASWATTDKYPNDVLQSERTPQGSFEYVRYTEADFDQITERIESEIATLHAFTDECFAVLKERPPKPPL